MSQILEAIQIVAPLIKELSINDVAVTIADRQYYIDFIRSESVPQLVNKGDIIPDGTVVKECMDKNKKIIRKVPKEVLGFPYIASGMPVVESGEIVGAISFVTPLERQEKLIELSETLSNNLESLGNISQSMEDTANDLFGIANSVNKATNKLNANIDATDSIIEIIQGVSKQTNLLGLNAVIEAARVGVEGRGFGIVAEEIRKLSTEIAVSVKKIEGVLLEIKAASANQNKIIDEIQNIIDVQKLAASTINASIQELYAGINLLLEYAKDLSRE